MMRDIIVWLDMVAPLTAFFAGLFLVKNILSHTVLRWLMFYLLSSSIVNGTGNIVSEVFLVNNHVVYHFGNLVNALFLTLYFYHLPAMAAFKKLVILLAIVFAFITISFTLINQNFFQFDSFGFAMSSILFTLLSMVFYHGLIQNQKGENLLKLSEFWAVTGVFFYFASCFLIFILYKHFTDQGIHTIGLLWKFQNIMLSIMCVSLIKGFLCSASRTNLLLL